MKYLIGLMLLSSQVFASEIIINSFYLLDRQSQGRDSTAEVCFSVRPAPTALTHVKVTVDKGTNAQGFYNTWIDERGSSCLVVSTLRGTVEVNIPSLGVATQKDI